MQNREFQMAIALAQKQLTILILSLKSREKMGTPRRDIVPESLSKVRSTKTQTNVQDTTL
jgi:hypothetical protein